MEPAVPEANREGEVVTAQRQFAMYLSYLSSQRRIWDTS